jgi:hypothetical protein
LSELASLDKNLCTHHQFESDLVTLEESSVDIPIGFIGKALSDIVHPVFDEV